MTTPGLEPPMDTHAAWNQFRLAVYRLAYRVQTPMLLPEYKGSVFRGALGHHLKRVSDDAYRQLFETTQESVRGTPPPEGASPFLANLNEIPTPYVLEPPLTAQRFF